LGRALWWCPQSSGYTSLVDQAGRYTKEEADAICSPGENIAVPEQEVLAKTVQIVLDFGQWEDEKAVSNAYIAEHGSELKRNAEKVAKELGYVGHGGYEREATVVDDEVYCECAHCGEAFHPYLKVTSLDPLTVSVDDGEFKEYESIDALRSYVEDYMVNAT
jgi:hypothetical protein